MDRRDDAQTYDVASIVFGQAGIAETVARWANGTVSLS
jgi:hypothetical protein